MKSKNILGISAHADDHVMFAGTVMKLQDMGYNYYEAVLTKSNEFGGSKVSEGSDKIEKLRNLEFELASKFLGTRETFYLDQEDQNLTYNKELMHKLIRIIRQVKPEVGFSMSKIDVHPDHIAASNLAVQAFRWAAKSFRPELGDPHRTSVVLLAEGTLPIEAAVMVDISDYIEKKIELFSKYESQADQSQLDLLRAFAIVRGQHLRKKGRVYAEAFTTDQNIIPLLFE